jgi:hypothetical protein
MTFKKKFGAVFSHSNNDTLPLTTPPAIILRVFAFLPGASSRKNLLESA